MRDDPSGGSRVETAAPDEMSQEIEARLSVRRRFYKRTFAVFALVELAISVPSALLNPAMRGYILAACASAILGTAAVLVWAYEIRKSALYEKARRALLHER
jgi:hypothetical protein